MADSDMVTTRIRAISRVLRTRSGALLAVAAVTATWSIIGLPAARVAGLLGVAAVLIALTTRFSHQSVVDQRLADNAAQVRAVADRLEDRVAELSGGLNELASRLHAELASRLHATHEDFMELSDAVSQAESVAGEQLSALRDAHARFSDRLDEVAGLVERVEFDVQDNVQLTRAGVRSLRIELSDISGRMPRFEGTSVNAKVSKPLISIAIPGFNRPHELEVCLESIVREVEATGSDRVEVWVTDDLSTVEEASVIARRFAQDYPYIGFRQNAVNRGLERNLIKACEPCTGEYLWIIGNDDIVYDGGLEIVLDDANEGLHDVLLYDRTRIDHTGDKELVRTPGCIPIDVGSGERRSYENLLDFARKTGVLSGFGFISTLVLRRARFVSASADPYLGLTMYPQVGVLLESCAESAVLFNNTPVIYHRTRTRPEKLAEALGRREEGFMAGGDERDPRWFGDSLAALFQRVIDRSSLAARDFVDLPELLFGYDSLIDYIEHNRKLRLKSGFKLPDDVVYDAERFLAAVDGDGSV